MTISVSGNSSTARVSVSNGTTATLASGATFTGAWETNSSPEIFLFWKFDTAVTVYVDFSNDGGTTTHSTYPTAGFKTIASRAGAHVVKKAGRSIRIRVTNTSAGAQTSASLGCYYGSFGQLMAPMSQSQTLESDAIVTRSIPSELDLDLGGFSDITASTKFANVEAIDAADGEVDVWAAANDGLTGRISTKTFPTVASTFYIASTSAADTAKTIRIEGLDSAGLEVTTDVVLNGTTPVTCGTLLDVNRAYLNGDNQTLIGDVWIAVSNAFTAGRPTTAAETVAFIPIGYGQTQQIQISVPSNRRCRISSISASIARASGTLGSAEFNVLTKEASKSWRVRRHYDVTTNGSVNKSQSGFVLGASARITIRLLGVSDSDTDANAQIDYEFIDIL